MTYYGYVHLWLSYFQQIEHIADIWRRTRTSEPTKSVTEMVNYRSSVLEHMTSHLLQWMSGCWNNTISCTMIQTIPAQNVDSKNLNWTLQIYTELLSIELLRNSGSIVILEAFINLFFFLVIYGKWPTELLAGSCRAKRNWEKLCRTVRLELRSERKALKVNTLEHPWVSVFSRQER